ncbi:anaerobic glycerol-3-phosphate dehydrogenase subunit B [Enhygromyxa salina]|uniref:Anaerobic glycerol-3-phosphate dehydrogenase subunit B n=1 Tax=Enhygromyxa salina TaxID=215803 RepID=A0A2S9XII8_9BACT|nr:FAD-dependent oxidoreductase [Enhygromyxa salina]PRP92663.1 anaerobic glycerol-3-phosphate dehydrogenase subunit B [Enhygromyxa salina]
MPRTVDVLLDPDAFADEARLRRAAARKAKLRERDVRHVVVRRRSVDARGGEVKIRAQVELWKREPPPSSRPKPWDLPTLRGEAPVVIIGAGPAGLFCALALTRAGVRSIIIERGQAVSQRRRDVADLSARGVLHPESNYCFGEGGAGTFSDGKLYTRAHKRGPVDEVLRVLVAHGAPLDLLVDARPHIGTNRLPGVVTSLREQLEHAGVQVRFGARATGLRTKDGVVTGVELDEGEHLDAAAVVIATGHSARDVVRFVRNAGAAVRFKPFALGVRVEHPQPLIDRVQYGGWAGHPVLGAASYRLVQRVGETSVFSFCMCPGGHIVPAATELDGQVVNGWSPSSRRGRFANSGFVAEIGAPQLRALGLDPNADPLAGIEFQRHYERAAFEAGGGAFVGPAQGLRDFVEGRHTNELPPCSYPRGVSSVRLDELLGPLASPIQAALGEVARSMPEFLGPEALAVGVESRTSAPYRIERDKDTLQSPSLARLYPCGEGAGFAGGIMSAALDGIRVAKAITARVRTSGAPRRASTHPDGLPAADSDAT